MDNTDTLKLLETKFVEVGEDKVPIKLTFRAMIEFEKLTGTPVNFAEGTEQITILFYCAAKAGARAMKKEFDHDYESFLDYIDEKPECILSFYDTLVDGIDTPETPDEKKKVVKRPSTSKKSTGK